MSIQRLLILSLVVGVVCPDSDYSKVKLFCKDLPVEQVTCGGDDLDKQFSPSTEVNVNSIYTISVPDFRINSSILEL